MNILDVVIWNSDVLDLGGSFSVLRKLSQDHGVWICSTRNSLLTTSSSTTRFTAYQATAVMNSLLTVLHTIICCVLFLIINLTEPCEISLNFSILM